MTSFENLFADIGHIYMNPNRVENDVEELLQTIPSLKPHIGQLGT
jgi:hypothetical protein